MPLRSALVAALALLALSSPAFAQVYSWTDERGVVHYTADPAAVPPAYRTSDMPVATEPVLVSPPTEQRRGGWETWGVPQVVKPATTTVQFSPGEPIVVAAHLNGVRLALLLDTGADRTLVTPDAVLRAGYGTLMAQAGAVAIIGVTGAATAPQVTVPSLDVAGARVGPLSLLVHDAGLTGIDGLLGRDVLDAFTVTIDSAAGRATLTPR
jgi:hypothetical protein